MTPIERGERVALLQKLTAEISRREKSNLYEGKLIDFIEYVWPVVEPAIPFVRGWAIDAICEHLEAVTTGEITRLLINVPPGFTKSLITDVFWPAWEWGPRNMPHLRYVCASYASHLTIRDNMRCRNVVLSDRYQRYWSNRFKVSSEQFTKVKFANDRTGWKFATSVTGVTGGERGDRFIIDDANNPTDMESDTVRSGTNQWFTEVVPDRLNNITNSAIVAIQQRLHEEDISGTALTLDLGYVHLMIPMEYDPSRHCITTIGWQDPRGIDEDGITLPDDEREQHDGELAWPERFPPEAIRVLKQKGDYAWSGQYQQSPEPRGGGIFKRDWWERWEKQNQRGAIQPPPLDYVVGSLDTAYTEKEENDPSAMSVWGVFHDDVGNPKIILLDAWQKRLPLHGPTAPSRMDGETDYSYMLRAKESWGLVEWVGETCRKWKVDRLLIEAAASGISVAQEIRRIYGAAEWATELIDPKGDKVARAYSVQHLFAEGMIYAAYRESGWVESADMVINQAATFPKAAHDDLVDSMTQALRHLRLSGLAMRVEEAQYERDEAKRFKRKPRPLYPA